MFTNYNSPCWIISTFFQVFLLTTCTNKANNVYMMMYAITSKEHRFNPAGIVHHRSLSLAGFFMRHTLTTKSKRQPVRPARGTIKATEKTATAHGTRPGWLTCSNIAKDSQQKPQGTRKRPALGQCAYYLLCTSPTDAGGLRNHARLAW